MSLREWSDRNALPAERHAIQREAVLLGAIIVLATVAGLLA
jgi:hypothetical protein